VNLPFGKYKGEDISDVDLGYLKWLEEQSWCDASMDELRKHLQHEIARREGDVSSLGRETRRAK
jgi:uncharacterized protein (DUF3820 family)